MTDIEQLLRQVGTDERTAFIPSDDLPERIARRTRQRHQHRQIATGTVAVAALVALLAGTVGLIHHPTARPRVATSVPSTLHQRGLTVDPTPKIVDPAPGAEFTGALFPISGTARPHAHLRVTWHLKSPVCALAAPPSAGIQADGTGHWHTTLQATNLTSIIRDTHGKNSITVSDVDHPTERQTVNLNVSCGYFGFG